MKRVKALRMYIILVISVSITACGGGGGGGGGNSSSNVSVRDTNPPVIVNPVPVAPVNPVIPGPGVNPEEPEINPREPELVPEAPVVPEVNPAERVPAIEEEPAQPVVPVAPANPEEPEINPREPELVPEAPVVPEVNPAERVPAIEEEPAPVIPEAPVVPAMRENPIVEERPMVKPDAPVAEDRYVEVKPENVPGLKADNDHAKFTGKGVTVAVLDSDFKTTKAYFDEEFGDRLTALDRDDNKYNGSEHGKWVSSVIGSKTYGVAKNVKIVAVSLGETESNGKAGGIASSRAEYEKILKENPDIKIFNQSFGLPKDLKQLKPAIVGPMWQPMFLLSTGVSDNQGRGIFNFYKEQVQAGKLFIWAAGNTIPGPGGIGTVTTDNPFLQPALPYLVNEHIKEKKDSPRIFISDDDFTDEAAAKLSDGWLSVVGIDPNTNKHYIPGSNSKTGHLAYAGVAKEWSVSASAESIIGREVVVGSSFAAPKVAGVAALISEKYPWMNGNNIKQTILTTAGIIDDMIDPSAFGRTKDQLSDKYGWGLLNKEKALNGPSEFSDILNREEQGRSYFKAKLGNTGKASTFSNEIVGSSGLIKSGQDKLILSRNNTYLGNTNINEGPLELWGSSKSKMNISRNGELLLKNDLTLSKDVVNAGTLTILEDSNPTILEDYTAYKNSTTRANMNSSLYVKGEARIDEEASFELIKEGDKYIPRNDRVMELMVSDNKIEGHFKKNDSDTLIEEKIDTVENKVLAVVSRKDTEEYAKIHSNDATTLSVAKNLELAFDELDERIKRGDDNLETLTKEAALLQTTSLSLSPTSSHLDSLSGQLYASAQSLTFKQAEFVNKEISNRLATLGMLQSSDKKYGAWMSYFGSKAKLEREGYAKADTDLSGQQFGFDRKFNSLVLGASFVHSNAKANFNRYSGSAKSESFGVSLYGRKEFYANKLYVQGKVSAHSVKTKVEREILNTKSSIKHKDLMLSSYLETGYNFRIDRNTISPFIAIESNRLQRGSFSENSSNFALKADKKVYHQNIFKVGIREQFKFDINNKIPTTFSMYLLQNINLSNRSLDFDAKFVSTDTNVKVKGIGMAPNSTHFGVGMVAELTPSIATYMNFDASLEKKKVASTMYTVGFRWSF